MRSPIVSVRRGFATNSSSCHSLILLRPDDWVRDNWDGTGYFERSHFVLQRPEHKVQYLLGQCAAQGRTLWEPCLRAVRDAVHDRFGDEFDYLLRDVNFDEYYVDHQSQLRLPMRRLDPSTYAAEYWRDFADFVLRDDACILGGDDDGHPLLYGYGSGDNRTRAAIDVDNVGPWWSGTKRGERSLAHKDPVTGVWTVFTPGLYGTKVRYDFGPQTKCTEDVVRDKRGSYPELCDLKITSYCVMGCPWCYQGSSPTGKHAPVARVEAYLRNLARVGCFEVAIGGGEPTEHPEFASILQTAHKVEVLPSFSTGSLDWLSNARTVEAVWQYVGAFGVSLHPCQASMHEILDRAHAVHLDHRVVFHYVLGSEPAEVFERRVKQWKEDKDTQWRDMLLLAPKRSGRGAGQTWYPIPNWIDILREHNVYAIGVDTMLAKEYEESLCASGIDRKTYEVEEGLHSFYIDAVENRAAASSFLPEGRAVTPEADLEEVFRGVQEDHLGPA